MCQSASVRTQMLNLVAIPSVAIPSAAVHTDGETIQNLRNLTASASRSSVSTIEMLWQGTKQHLRLRNTSLRGERPGNPNDLVTASLSVTEPSRAWN